MSTWKTLPHVQMPVRPVRRNNVYNTKILTIMKKILFTLLITLTIFGCGNEEAEKESGIPVTLEFKINKTIIEPNSLNQIIDINATTDFKVKIEGLQENDKWLSYTLSSNKLNINAKPNNSESPKTAYIIIFEESNKVSDRLEITQTTNQERIALIKIYEALNGDNWTNNENWCSDKPLSEWYGITANGDTNVKTLWLPNDAYIKGELPDCIASLNSLEELCFENTSLSGNLPSTIIELTKLNRIALKNCNLSGNIPEFLKSCIQLEYIDLSHNIFSGYIPESLFQLPNLFYLALDNNQLETFEIKNDIPKTKLSYLAISNNQISSSIPPNLFKIKSLAHLFANDNQISGTIPDDIGSALNLMTLNLYNNNITGKLPKSMINLQLLNSFNITSNYLDVTNTDYLKSNPNFANWRIGNQKTNY